MARLRSFLLGCVSLLTLAGCLGHSRPNGVPASAVWADHVFIQCSTEVQTNSDRCTVYRDDSGEILADGLFILQSTDRAAAPQDLKYLAYGKDGIYLSNLQILFQRSATSRDPSLGLVINRLTDLASKLGGTPIACNTSKVETDRKCAQEAFASKSPFYVLTYYGDKTSFSRMGIAGDSKGNLSAVVYRGGHPFVFDDSGGEQRPENGNISSYPCPLPQGFRFDGTGQLACAWQPAKHAHVIIYK